MKFNETTMSLEFFNDHTYYGSNTYMGISDSQVHYLPVPLINKVLKKYFDSCQTVFGQGIEAGWYNSPSSDFMAKAKLVGVTPFRSDTAEQLLRILVDEISIVEGDDPANPSLKLKHSLIALSTLNRAKKLLEKK